MQTKAITFEYATPAHNTVEMLCLMPSSLTALTLLGIFIRIPGYDDLPTAMIIPTLLLAGAISVGIALLLAKIAEKFTLLEGEALFDQNSVTFNYGRHSLSFPLSSIQKLELLPTRPPSKRSNDFLELSAVQIVTHNDSLKLRVSPKENKKLVKAHTGIITNHFRSRSAEAGAVANDDDLRLRKTVFSELSLVKVLDEIQARTNCYFA